MPDEGRRFFFGKESYAGNHFPLAGPSVPGLFCGNCQIRRMVFQIFYSLGDSGRRLLTVGILILTDSIPQRIQTLCWGLWPPPAGLCAGGGGSASLCHVPNCGAGSGLPGVLGAQVKGTRPSLSLQYRIDSACEYLKENPGTRAVLSGGKGARTRNF